MDYLQNLNQNQLEAVKTIDGPVMVIAGAGSGKTRVLTNRVIYMIKELNIPAYNILAITFTNKAALEMRTRIENTIKNDIGGMWCLTFHAMCARILRFESEAIGYSKDFQIIDDQDSEKIIKEIMVKEDYDIKKYLPKSFLKMISSIKSKVRNFEEFDNPIYDMLVNVFTQYGAELKRNNLIDFDDLLLLTYKLFNENEMILNKYQNHFRYILVDEFQDTNNIQYDICRLLALRHHNLFIVGDEDQSIYAFRGANILNIKKFMTDFKEYKKIVIDQNYRSTNNILKCANSVINRNGERIKKNLWSENGDGKLIEHYEAETDLEEAWYVVNSIKRKIREGSSLRDFAILYRNNSLSRLFEDELIKNQIPYKVFGSISFYKRKEIKDVVAYLRLMINPNDEFSFKRVCNEPKRGLGKTSIDKLFEYRDMTDTSLMDAIDNIELGKAKSNLLSFKNMILSLKEKIDLYSLEDYYDAIISDTGYLEYVKALDDEDHGSRVENIKEFKNMLVDRDSDEEDESTYTRLSKILIDISLKSEFDEDEENNDYVTLQTIHSAKGLEYKIVYLVVFESGIFPNNSSMMSTHELEEERRLCYVAMTRAEKELYISNARSRFVYGRSQYQIISPFFKEIDKNVLSSNTLILPEPSFPKPKAKVNEDVIKIVKEKPKADLKAGDKVMHESFGLGVVVSVDDIIATIAFKIPYGVKKLIKNHPTLKKVE